MLFFLFYYTSLFHFQNKVTIFIHFYTLTQSAFLCIISAENHKNIKAVDYIKNYIQTTDHIINILDTQLFKNSLL